MAKAKLLSLLGLLSLSLAGALLTWASEWMTGSYGLTRFLGIPFILGFLASIAISHQRPNGLFLSLSIGSSAVLLCWILLFALGIDGLIRLSLSLPLALLAGSLGGLAEFQYSKHALAKQHRSKALAFASLALLGIPLIESQVSRKAKLQSVVTSMEIDASPSKVWSNVLEYPEIHDKPGIPFQAGISYPIKTELHGEGIGAKRISFFSTGICKEKIVGWEKDKLLHYEVIESPAPIKELSPYKDVRESDLKSFIEARAGQYRLVRLHSGRTRLEHTSWYYQDLSPLSYWARISESVIRGIQQRTLDHIRRQSEQPAALAIK